MLKAIKAMYSSTKNVMKSAVIECSIGVRQGVPTSCLLFTIYVDKMVKMLKDGIGTDNFLRSLHVLLLMDDSVSESWVTNKVKGLEIQYNSLVKCLLGVRKNTSNKLCMVESSIPPFTEVVKKRRYNCLKAKVECADIEQPFRIVYEFCRQENTPGYRFLIKKYHRDQTVTL